MSGFDVGDHHDLLILGSGSTAFAAATRASEVGKTAIMIEERTLGGTCVNRGCLPSKNLLEAAKLIYDAARPRYAGLTPARIDVDFPALVAQKDELVSEYRGQHYASIFAAIDDRAPVQIVYGRAALLDAHTAEVITPDGATRRITGDQVLIATGSSPIVPELPGLDDIPYLTSDLLTSGEGLELTELPLSLVIVGGGAIALELGQLFTRLGSQVTLLERSSSLLPGFEPEVGRELITRLREEGLRILTEAHVQGVAAEGGRVRVTIHGQPEDIRAQKLLIAAGRQPNTRNIGLERAGVRLDERGAVVVNVALQTSVPHIWAAGDVIGGETESQMATPVGAHDGGIAASNALTGASHQVDHTVIPRTIFTDPQVATVGLTDTQAHARGITCRCSTIPMSVVPRSGAIHDTRGIVKMVIEHGTKRVLGVSIVGTNAGEIIHEAAMALRFGATTADFIDLIHVYPTMAEALKLAALSFTKDVRTLSCCAN